MSAIENWKDPNKTISAYMLFCGMKCSKYNCTWNDLAKMHEEWENLSQSDKDSFMKESSKPKRSILDKNGLQKLTDGW